MARAGWLSWCDSRFLCALAGLVLLDAGAAAQPASLVRDLTPGTEQGLQGYTYSLARLGDFLFAAGTDPLRGTELWRFASDGSGGELVADLCPGACSSYPRQMIVAGDRLFFMAHDEATGTELWVSDGTRAGTRLVRDVCPGPCDGLNNSGLVSHLAAIGNLVFFTADDGITGQELWVTDGTPEGTSLVTDLSPGLFRFEPVDLTPFGGALFFAPGVVDLGGIWRSNGSSAGTFRLNVPCTSFCDAPSRVLGATAQRLLLQSGFCQPGQGTNLWTYSTAGQFRSIPLCAGDTFTAAAFQGNEAFVGLDQPASLWKVDLTTGGAVQLASWPSNSIGPEDLTVSDSLLFFTNSTTAAGRELWVSDGTAAGTRSLNLSPEAARSIPFYPLSLTPLGNRVVFDAFGDAVGYEPWVSDGTLEGTHVLQDIWPGPEVDAPTHSTGSSFPNDFVPVGSQLFFTAMEPGNLYSLWQTDGTTAGTQHLRDLHAPQPISSRVAGLTALDDRLFFSHAPNVGVVAQPWTSDGTAAGTQRLDTDDRPINAFPGAVPLAGSLYFVALDSTNQHTQLYRSDGTPGGTAQVAGNFRDPNFLTPLDGKLFFVATDSTCSCQILLALDPASSQVEPRGLLGGVQKLLPFGHRLIYVAQEALWITDGTSGGSHALMPVGCLNSPIELAPVGSQMLFSTDSVPGLSGCPVLGSALWRTDGTPFGTVKVRDFPEVPFREYGVTLRDLVSLDSRVFFLLPTSTGDELWVSDGTATGTVRVKALSLGSLPAAARQLTVVGDRLFLAVFNPDTGEELWTSDGTSAGTHLVVDLNPGPAGSAPQSFAAVDGRLLFAADDGTSGLELWASNGTREGTVLLQDIAPGPAPSSPSNLTVTRDHVFFLAGDGIHGRELWTMRRSAAAGCRASDTTLCLQGGRFAISVHWQTPNVPGGQGVGHSVPVSGSDQTGAFWFFGPSNVELLVKMIYGTSVNGSFWFFSGALSDVAYQIEVTDVFTGATRTYTNAAGNLCGQADTSAFPGSPARAASLSRPSEFPASAGSCASPSPNALCLGAGGRFRIEVSFRNQHAGGATGVGTSLPGTADSGFFWFFDPALYELAVKVLDGTAVNGHSWLFYGALSDVEYTLTVTDSLTGTQKSYHNPPGQLCGRADVTAF